MSMAARVRSIGFHEDGAVFIEWVDVSTDVHPNGLIFNHAVVLPPEAYEDEIQSIHAAVKIALKRALQDAQRPDNQPVPTPLADTGMDEVGPYEYPDGAKPKVDVNAPCVGCFICGDPDDHNGQPHSAATGDGRTRRDVEGPAVPVPWPPVEPESDA